MGYKIKTTNGKNFRKAFSVYAKPLFFGAVLVTFEIICLSPDKEECYIHCSEHTHPETHEGTVHLDYGSASATTLASGVQHGIQSLLKIES